MKRRGFVELLAAGLPSVFAPRWPAWRSDDRFVERWSWAMGQAVHVMVFARSEGEGLDACAAALAELRRVESRLTLFDDASDVCELNRHAGRGRMRLDRDLLAALQAADGARRATGGGFAVAVEPLMRAWGFHRTRSLPPSRSELAEAREAVVTAVIELDGETARLPNAHTQIDLGGIGVGFGIDRALTVLSARGIRRAFIDVSGDCGTLGPPPGDPGWLVEIADPDRPGATIAATRLSHSALATSANTASIVHYGDLVAGHVLDPRTGRTAGALRQATVVAATATAADALSTGMLVSGQEPSGTLRTFVVPSRPPSGAPSCETPEND